MTSISLRAVWTTLDDSSQCQQRSTTPDLVPADPPPGGCRPWIHRIPLTWSDAEPAIIGDIAVVLHHSTDDRGANQRAAGERQARYQQAGERCLLWRSARLVSERCKSQ